MKTYEETLEINSIQRPYEEDIWVQQVQAAVYDGEQLWVEDVLMAYHDPDADSAGMRREIREQLIDIPDKLLAHVHINVRLRAEG